MELTGGYPYSLIRYGLLYHYPKLLQDIKCDVLVIGAGISGALTAWYLTEAGVSCCVVDGRTVALGSTCASTSLLQYELDIPLHILAKKNSMAARAYQLCGEAVDKLVGLMDKLHLKAFGRKQSLFFSTHTTQKKFMQNECRARKDAGFDVMLLSREELHNQYGLNAHYGILSAKGAHTDAYLLTHSLLQDIVQKGSRVFDRTKIKSLEYNKQDVSAATADGFTIRADYVVNATGYEVINFIGKGIVNLDCTYAIISDIQPGANEYWKDNIMLWDTDHPYLYTTITHDNRIILGGRDEAFSNDKTLHGLVEKKSKQLEKDFTNIFPAIPFRQEFAWSGVFGKTKDSLPYIGQWSKTPGTFYALGFGGNGITFSLIAAEIIRDALLGRKNADAELFSFDRP